MDMGKSKKNAIFFLIYLLLTMIVIGCLHNQPPVADAGENKIVFVGDLVELDGSASYDPESLIVEYKWELTQVPRGSQIHLEQFDGPNPVFLADKQGVYIIELVVFDGELYSTRDQVVVVARDDVVHDSRALYRTLSGEPVSIDSFPPGVGNDFSAKGRWEVLSKPEGAITRFADANAMKTEFSADLAGEYQLKYYRTPGDDKNSLSVMVIVMEAPLIMIGDTETVVGERLLIQLLSVFPLTEDDIQWGIVSPEGDAEFMEVNPNGAVFLANSAGEYQIVVTVTVPEGEFTDTFRVIVNEQTGNLFEHPILVDNCSHCHDGIVAVGKPVRHPDTSDLCEQCHHIDQWLPFAVPEPIPAPEPVFPEGIEITLRGAGDVYPQGALIKLEAVFSNNGTTDVEYHRLSSTDVGLRIDVRTVSGLQFTLSHPDDPAFDAPFVQQSILMPGESITRSVVWDQTLPSGKKALPGEYEIIARIEVTHTNGNSHGEFQKRGSIVIESEAVFITEVEAIVAGLAAPEVDLWYEANQRSILCSTQTRGLVQVIDYKVNPINTLGGFAPVPDSEINCNAELLAADSVWLVMYRSTSPSQKQRFKVEVNAITGDIVNSIKPVRASGRP